LALHSLWSVHTKTTALGDGWSHRWVTIIEPGNLHEITHHRLEHLVRQINRPRGDFQGLASGSSARSAA
jgi:hypothetical protein